MSGGGPPHIYPQQQSGPVICLGTGLLSITTELVLIIQPQNGKHKNVSSIIVSLINREMCSQRDFPPITVLLSPVTLQWIYMSQHHAINRSKGTITGLRHDFPYLSDPFLILAVSLWALCLLFLSLHQQHFFQCSTHTSTLMTEATGSSLTNLHSITPHKTA
jgi:hypothetical protein